jgi:hypothetical protein
MSGGNNTDAERTINAGAPEAAIAIRIFREILLVMRFRIIKRFGGNDLRGDGAIASLCKLVSIGSL